MTHLTSVMVTESLALLCVFFFQAEDGIRDLTVTGVQTCALPISALQQAQRRAPGRADLHKLQGDVALKVGDKAGALAAYRSALELDRGYVQVWLDRKSVV